MWLDCKKVDTQPMDPRGRLDLDGHIVLGKHAETGESVAVRCHYSYLFCSIAGITAALF